MPSTTLGGKLIPEILDKEHVRAAADLVTKYFRLTSDGLPVYTGSHFNSWAGGGDAEGVANTITADDLVAVSLLSVKVPGPAAFGILKTHSKDISKLLLDIPRDIDLADLEANQFEEILGDNSPADKLWRLLRAFESPRWGIGPTTASKIMARKRPRLIPIYDSVVRPLMGLKNSRGHWAACHAALTDGSDLAGRLQEIRAGSGISEPISDLRTMDIVLWMYGKQNLPHIAWKQLKLAKKPGQSPDRFHAHNREPSS